MRRTAWTLCTLGGLAAAYYGLLGRLHHREIAALNQDIDASYAGLARAEQEMALSAELQRTIDELQALRGEFAPRVSRDPAATPPLLAVRNLLEGSGLEIESAETLAPEAKLQAPHQALHFVVRGLFAELFAAIERIESSFPPTRVSNLSVRATAADGRVRGDLVIVRTWSLER